MGLYGNDRSKLRKLISSKIRRPKLDNPWVNFEGRLYNVSFILWEMMSVPSATQIQSFWHSTWFLALIIFSNFFLIDTFQKFLTHHLNAEVP